MQSYQLFINLKKDVTIQIGKLGNFDFPRGSYVYTGSAKKNIDQRIKRHLAQDKKLHWHIDYFLMDKNVEVVDVKEFSIDECRINQELVGEVIVKGFGSSDCKKNCQSHLKFLN